MVEPERMRKSRENRSLRVIHAWSFRIKTCPLSPNMGTLTGVENGAGAPGERWRRDVMVEMERRGWCGGVG